MSEIVVIEREELQTLINESIQQALIATGLATVEPERVNYYSTKEVRQILEISHVTMWRYEKMGYLRPVRLGGKKFYEKEAIDTLKDAQNKKKAG